MHKIASKDFMGIMLSEKQPVSMEADYMAPFILFYQSGTIKEMENRLVLCRGQAWGEVGVVSKGWHGKFFVMIDQLCILLVVVLTGTYNFD